MKPKVITLAEYKEKKGLVDKPRKKLKNESFTLIKMNLSVKN